MNVHNYIILRNVEKNSKDHWEYRKFLTKESEEDTKKKETSRRSRRKVNLKINLKRR